MQFKTNSFLLIVESLIYSSGQMFLGLLLHPYRSVQILVKNKILLPFVFYPTLIAFVSYFLLSFDQLAFFYDKFWLMQFFYHWLFFFCFYWQLALFYLWFRFSRAFKHHAD